MSDPVRLPRMTSDEFLAWAMQQPEGQRYELVEGEVVAMAPERVIHSRVKLRVARRLAEAVEAAGLPCEVFTDGMAVQVDEGTAYEPDALLRCGAPLPDDAIVVPDPIVIVEVASPSTQSLDAGAKLADYFRLSSLRHYLILRAKARVAILHSRDESGTITTRIIRDGPIALDPPGITVDGVFG